MLTPCMLWRVAFVSVLALLAVQVLFTYWPPMQTLFGTTALDAASWPRILLFGIAAFTIVELEKIAAAAAIFAMSGNRLTCSIPFAGLPKPGEQRQKQSGTDLGGKTAPTPSRITSWNAFAQPRRCHGLNNPEE